jgi:hypothetical protein
MTPLEWLGYFAIGYTIGSIILFFMRRFRYRRRIRFVCRAIQACVDNETLSAEQGDALISLVEEGKII